MSAPAVRVSEALLHALRLYGRGYTVRQAAMLAGLDARALRRAVRRAERACRVAGRHVSQAGTSAGSGEGMP